MGKRNNTRDVAALIGARIEFLRRERGFSLRKLAGMVECSFTLLSFMESGLSPINVIMLQKIARALQVEPFDLLNYAPENDDLEYIVEKMRQDPKAHAMVKAKVKAQTSRRRVGRRR